MATKMKKAKILVGLTGLAGLLVYSLLCIAGDLEPIAPPGPTMKTLDQIYNAVVASGSPAIA